MLGGLTSRLYAIKYPAWTEGSTVTFEMGDSSDSLSTPENCNNNNFKENDQVY
ncbi:hypothetical protein HOLleu_26875 [Holothuria leucospilota]|uniref:Uncharacterized protein n=1 Tax=Holothuria leucospilota TaxID=206669 RepID=A0A9Q1BPH8_HOLLE|nr:hypothetical protein HOLleu_26875 [Holothuria leucospilota]